VRRVFIGFVMVVVVGLAAAGCGGSGSDWTTVTTLRSSDPPELSGLNGSYVLVVPAPGPNRWSVEIQTAD
jgi:hypothetical protein